MGMQLPPLADKRGSTRRRRAAGGGAAATAPLPAHCSQPHVPGRGCNLCLQCLIESTCVRHHVAAGAVLGMCRLRRCPSCRRHPAMHSFVPAILTEGEGLNWNCWIRVFVFVVLGCSILTAVAAQLYAAVVLLVRGAGVPGSSGGTPLEQLYVALSVGQLWRWLAR